MMAETLIRTDLSISCLLFALTWQNGAFWREMLFLPQVTEISLTGIRHGGISPLEAQILLALRRECPTGTMTQLGPWP